MRLAAWTTIAAALGIGTIIGAEAAVAASVAAAFDERLEAL